MQVNKSVGDRLTIVILCASPSETLKTKLLFVLPFWNSHEHSSRTKSCKRNCVSYGEQLPGSAGNSSLSGLNLSLDQQWKNLLLENGLPFKALLFFDNVPVHSHKLGGDILPEFKFIKIMYLSRNTNPSWTDRWFLNLRSYTSSTCFINVLRSLKIQI